MKRKVVNQFTEDTPEYVIAHTKYQKLKGRNPSVPYKDVFNPKLARSYALIDLANKLTCEIVKQLANNPVASIKYPHVNETSNVFFLRINEDLQNQANEKLKLEWKKIEFDDSLADKAIKTINLMVLKHILSAF